MIFRERGRDHDYIVYTSRKPLTSLHCRDLSPPPSLLSSQNKVDYGTCSLFYFFSFFFFSSLYAARSILPGSPSLVLFDRKRARVKIYRSVSRPGWGLVMDLRVVKGGGKLFRSTWLEVRSIVFPVRPWERKRNAGRESVREKERGGCFKDG